MDLEDELSTFTESVYAKLDDILDLEKFCFCGARITIYDLKNGACICGTPITIAIGENK